MNRQQADALRRENEARNSAQYQKTQASFAASNRASQAAHQAREAAASTAAHNARMKEYTKAGNALRDNFSSTSYNSRNASRDDSYGGSGGKGKSKGGGVLFVAVVIVGIIAVGGHSHSDSAGSAPASQQAPDTPSQVPQPLPQPPQQQLAPQTIAPDPNAGVTQEPVRSVSDLPANQGSDGSNVATTPPDENSPITKPLTSVPAAYPDEARQQNITGIVRLRVLIADDGSVHAAELEDGNPVLAPAALTAARQWTFNPTAPSDHYRISHLDFNFDGK